MSVIPEVDFSQAIRHLRRADPDLAPLIRRHGAPQWRRTRNSFESLGRAIVYQQLSGSAAATIYGRFLDLFPRRRFPRPDVLREVPLETLRSAGLSRAKASYLLDLAVKFDDGVIRPRHFARRNNEELIAELTQVKGIGTWSVHMFLMFGLLRPDVLATGDLGIRKGMRIYFNTRQLPAPHRMVRLAAAWEPYRSVASWYMWRVAENGLPG